MCGIGGIVRRDRGAVDDAALARMSAAMRERGPDDRGVWTAPGVGLVHTRLSVIDLSPAARCPMPSEDGSVQAVYNGEAYNFAELRAELQACGHRFRSGTDSEVVVHGYEEWGDGVLDRLEGMFALAVWDAPRERLLLARDRVGEKPLYYGERDGAVVFSSTLNGVVALLGATPEIDRAALACYLSHSFIPGPHTIWRGVQALPPAHRAVWERSTGALRLERWWEFPRGPRTRIGAGEAERRVEEALDRSVRARLVSDVPVGAFLSGGVDSSLVAALAAGHMPRLDTFSIGFTEADFSELPYARTVARALGTDHHELVVSDEDLFQVVPELVWQYGQPFGDSSAVPTHLVSRLARRDVTVALSGDGGDESFGGYWRAEQALWAAMYARTVPAAVRRGLVPAACGVMDVSPASGVARRLRVLNALSLAGSGAAYVNSESWHNGLDEILVFDERAGAHDRARCRTGGGWPGADSPVQRVLYEDFAVQLAYDYLVKVDVASMAASLEVRTPFLDHRLLELAWLLPDSHKVRVGKRKWLLKRIAARHVPREVVYRRKQGFALPMKHWWRGRLASVLSRLMETSRAVEWGWIRARPVTRALAEHRSGAANHATRLWLVLWLELWARSVCEGSLPRGASLLEAA